MNTTEWLSRAWWCQPKSVGELLDVVLPYPKKCCGQRQIALKRMQFANWINRHRDLSDAEIIENLKKML